MPRKPRLDAPLNEQEAYWYARLAKEGFEDIEDTSSPLRPLKAWHNLKWRNADPQHVASTVAYYTKARHVLQSGLFANKLSYRIWELHCDGLGVREIEKAIKGRKRKSAIAKLIKQMAEELI